MAMTMDTIIHQLKVVGAVVPGERLSQTMDGTLCIPRPTCITKAWRILSGDGRQRTCACIRNLLAAANEQYLLISQSRFLDEGRGEEHDRLVQSLQTLWHAANDCLEGIEALKVTYATDHSSVAHLDLLHTRCSMMVRNIRHAINE